MKMKTFHIETPKRRTQNCHFVSPKSDGHMNGKIRRRANRDLHNCKLSNSRDFPQRPPGTQKARKPQFTIVDKI